MHIVFIAVTQPLWSLHQLMTATDAWIHSHYRMPMSWFGFSAGVNVWWGLVPVDPPYCCGREQELIVLCHSGLPMGNRALIQSLCDLCPFEWLAAWVTEWHIFHLQGSGPGVLCCRCLLVHIRISAPRSPNTLLWVNTCQYREYMYCISD